MALTWKEIAARDPLRLNLGCGNGCHPDRRYPNYVCVDLRPQAPCAVRHDLTHPLPLPDACVERIVSEHFLEHMDRGSVIAIFAECFRVLRPGSLARFAVPDYLHPRYRHCLDLGYDPRRRDHTVLTTRPLIEELVAASPFGVAQFHHFWRDGQFVERPIDYELGYIRRTPEHDPRNRSSGWREHVGRIVRDVGEYMRHGTRTTATHRDTRRYHRLYVTSLVFDLMRG